MIEEPQRQLAAAIVHVVKDRAVPFRWIDGSQQIDVGLELDLPGGVARGEIEIDDPLIPRMGRIDLVVREADDPLVRPDVAERLAAGERLATQDF